MEHADGEPSTNIHNSYTHTNRKKRETSITPSCTGNRHPQINRTSYTLDV